MKSKRNRCLPQLESLESRQMLATMTVNVLSDGSLEELAGDGLLSLREAIQAIEIGGDVDGVAPTSGEFGIDDRIEFHPDLFMTPQPDTPTISMSGGEFKLTQPVDIVGPGRDLLLIDANRSSRVFSFTSEGVDESSCFRQPESCRPVELAGMTLSNGFIEASNANERLDPANYGGAIFASIGADLTLRDLRIQDSEVTLKETAQRPNLVFTAGIASGGGVAAFGPVTLIDSVVVANQAAGWGGGVFYARSLGDLTPSSLVRTALIDNVAHHGSGGGGHGISSVVASTISGNRANRVGGGIYSYTFADIESSVFDGNVAGNGGALYVFDPRDRGVIRDSQFMNNEAVNGGAIHSGNATADGRLSLENVTISGNLARNSGAIGNIGIPLEIRASRITNNMADFAPGVAVASPGTSSRGALLIEDSLITGNHSVESIPPQYGPSDKFRLAAVAISSSSTGLKVTNTTISDNVGGGIQALSAPVTIESSTIVSNRGANELGGVTLRSCSEDDRFDDRCDVETVSYQITNSLIASNTTTDVLVEECYVDLYADLQCETIDATKMDINISHTLIGSVLDDNILQPTGMTPDENGNLIGSAAEPIDPLIAPLADNGGRLPTHALYVGSPAIDAGTEQSDLSFDQRGDPFARVFGDRVDMGAHEQTWLQLPGDLDLDGDVDTADRSVMNQFWTGALMPDSIEPGDRRTFFQGDLDGDGDVDTADATIMAANWTGARLSPMQLGAATDLAFREI